MAFAQIATAIAVGVGTNLITSKIMGDPDMPKQIGSGTAPSLTPGGDIDIAEIAGSDVQNFDKFTSTDFAKPSAADQEMIMQELQNAGVSPEDLKNFGIPGMYVGGLLRKMNLGGALGGLASIPLSLFDSDMQLPDLLSNLPLPDININPADIDIPKPELSMYEKLLANYENLSPVVQEEINKGIAKIGSAALNKIFVDEDEEQKSLVRTNTLPTAGNANRRRMQFKPIGMKEGGNPDKVLNRKMFTPMLSGGELDGPGGPKDDLIPIMASDGEFMLSKATVDLVGNGNHNKGIAALQKLNNKGNRVYG